MTDINRERERSERMCRRIGEGFYVEAFLYVELQYNPYKYKQTLFSVDITLAVTFSLGSLCVRFGL